MPECTAQPTCTCTHRRLDPPPRPDHWCKKRLLPTSLEGLPAPVVAILALELIVQCCQIHPACKLLTTPVDNRLGCRCCLANLRRTPFTARAAPAADDTAPLFYSRQHQHNLALAMACFSSIVIAIRDTSTTLAVLSGATDPSAMSRPAASRTWACRPSAPITWQATAQSTRPATVTRRAE